MAENKEAIKGHLWWKFLILLLIALVVYISGRALIYFNTGADRELIYSQTASIINDAELYVKWSSKSSEVNVDSLDDYTANIIATAYGRGWTAWNSSVSRNNDLGLEDYFTTEMIDKLGSDSLLDQEILQRAALSHDLYLHFISEDYQYVIFTDKDADVYQDISSPDGQKISYHTRSDYLVHMVLHDGYWKISNLKRSQLYNDQKLDDECRSGFYTSGSGLYLDSALYTISGMNYYPQETSWLEFWSHFDSTVIREDLIKVKSLDLNIVRVFIPFSLFNEDYTLYTLRFEQFLNLANELDLSVIPTLFDFPEGYALSDYPKYNQYIYQMTTAARKYSNIVAWDIKNEPDLDFALYGQNEVIDFLDFAIDRLRFYDPCRLLTIGWSDAQFSDILSDRLDIVSFHFYKPVEQLSSVLMHLKEIHPDQPLLLEEFGLSSFNPWWYPIGADEKEQARYVQSVLQLCHENQIGFAVWCLYDYPDISKRIFGWKPWIRGIQSHFGVLDINGMPKPVHDVITNANHYNQK